MQSLGITKLGLILFEQKTSSQNIVLQTCLSLVIGSPADQYRCTKKLRTDIVFSEDRAIGPEVSRSSEWLGKWMPECHRLQPRGLAKSVHLDHQNSSYSEKAACDQQQAYTSKLLCKHALLVTERVLMFFLITLKAQVEIHAWCCIIQNTSPSIYHLFLFPWPLWMAHRTESWPLLLSSQNNKQIFIKTLMFTLHLQVQMGLLIACLIRVLDRPFIEYDDSSWWYLPATCIIDCSRSKVRSIEPWYLGSSESEDSVSDSTEDAADWSSRPLLPSHLSFLKKPNC